MARFVSKTAFLEMLGDQNLAAVLSAAKGSVVVEAWVVKFEAQKDPPGIDLDYESTREGLAALEAVGVLEAGTVDRMYPKETTGVRVRVRAPFAELFPGEYAVLFQSAEFWTIDGGIDFAPDYLQVI